MTTTRPQTVSRRARQTRDLPLKAVLAALTVGLSVATVLSSPIPGMISAAWPPKIGAFAHRSAGGGSAYIIGVSEGKVAVFIPPAEEPVIVTRIAAATLRAHDRAQLERGVAVDAYEELLGILESLGA